jgi:hypothetical protein
MVLMLSGQSQPPCHLSVFLEVTDSRNTSSDWSCFVSHRLSVVNQKMEDKSVTKESQNRYSKAAKDWGWREFVTLTSLFDQDSGFLVQDTVIFSAEVLILKETSIMQDFTEHVSELNGSSSLVDSSGKRSSFTWKVENFLSFKEIMETRKIFSKFFQAGGCELRIGMCFIAHILFPALYPLEVAIANFWIVVLLLKAYVSMLQVCMSHLIPYVFIWRVTRLLVAILIKTSGSDTEWLL